MRFLSLVLLVMLVSGYSSPAVSLDFAGSGVGAIPDNSSSGRTVSFSVSGVSGPLASIRVRLGLTHSFAGDVEAILRSPGGVSTLLLFGRTGVGYGQPNPSFGSPANFAGTYEFADDATQDLWATASPLITSATIPSGKYRTFGLGVVNTRHGGCSTSLAGAFNGLSGVQLNGTWTLTVADRVSGDTGTVDSALLSVSSSPDIFSSGFEDSPRGTCQLARYDYFGSGRSNYVLVRNTGGGATGAITWTIQDNDGTAAGAQQSFILGTAADRFVDLDFDGDGKTDGAVWTPATGQLLVRRSTRPGESPVAIAFGQNGDDPSHSGDYDGDGVDDFALYRVGASTGLASHTLVRLSSGGTRDLVTGENGAFPCGGIDYTGDGKADMAIQANSGGGMASFRIFNGSTGALVSTFLFGTPTDVVQLGNYVGTALGDVTVVKGVGGVINWTTRDGQSGVTQAAVPFGASATDFPLTGDYDGDGLDDYATWRPSATPGMSKFSVRPSSNTAAPFDVLLGANGDYPVANNRSH